MTRSSRGSPSEPSNPQAGGIEEFARAWPGRNHWPSSTQARTARGYRLGATDRPAARGAGITVLPVSGATGWDDIARRVAEATRDAAV